MPAIKRTRFQKVKDKARAFGNGLDRKQVVIYSGLTVLAFMAVGRLMKK
ncbi:MAG TPA: hypothetical protein VK154_01020 [Chitinophagales bacterium]|nr:hypothetical protein [Chitinophagales bacterium]